MTKIVYQLHLPCGDNYRVDNKGTHHITCPECDTNWLIRYKDGEWLATRKESK